jgi:hypothetical protein
MDTPGLSTDARRKTKGAEQLTLKRVNGVWRVVPESAPQINMLIRLLGSPL